MSNSALGSQSISLLTLPAGTLLDYAGTVEPSGWMLCDGRAVSRSEYATLFAAIGTSYGTGDGSTTFNIPDFRGRFARYNDNMGTAAGAAGRDTARVHGSDQGQATAKNGLTNSSTDLSHTHTYAYGTGNFTSGGSGPAMLAAGYNNNRNTSGASVSQNHTHTLSSSDSETRPINLSCNKLIKI